jgi:hypothetical protein
VQEAARMSYWVFLLLEIGDSSEDCRVESCPPFAYLMKTNPWDTQLLSSSMPASMMCGQLRVSGKE